jgi:hypothetical protein
MEDDLRAVTEGFESYDFQFTDLIHANPNDK